MVYADASHRRHEGFASPPPSYRPKRMYQPDFRHPLLPPKLLRRFLRPRAMTASRLRNDAVSLVALCRKVVFLFCCS